MKNASDFYYTCLSGASYSNSYVYTHLGQLWQGPLGGSGTQQQYLYCNSQPHELTGLYGTGATCTNQTGQVYASSYDSWGNVTSRTYSGTTATLTYDLLDHFVSWNAGAQNKDLSVYDASGTRVLRRTTTSSGTTMTVYAFGLEEHSYFNTGGHKGDLYYYSLGGRLLGALDNTGKTTFYLSDALGSVLASFSSAAGIAAIKGNQVFGPYGNARDLQGTINTAKGFTGQYNDSLTGLDYYNSRYYDQVAGVFLSADVKQGNMQGMNPYAYVNGNPETYNDPTGNCPACAIGIGVGIVVAPEVFVPIIVGGAIVAALGIMAWQVTHQSTGTTVSSSSTNGSATSSSTPSSVDPTAYWNAVQSYWLAWLAAHSQHGSGDGLTQSNSGSGQAASGGYAPPPPYNAPKNKKRPLPDNQPNSNAFGKLQGSDIRVSERGINIIENHLSRPVFQEPDGAMAPENEAMLQRLRAALEEGSTISGADASFYMHEIYESTLMDQGMLPEEAHPASFARYDVSPFSIYHPDVIQTFPERFNYNWFEFWRMLNSGD